MTATLLTRSEAEDRILTTLHQAAAGASFIIQAPRGMGKTSLLRRIARRVAGQGVAVALVEGECLGRGPLELARTLPDAFDRALGTGEPASATFPRALHIRQTLQQELAGRRPDPGHLLDLTFSYPEAVAADHRNRVVLLFDDAGEAVRHTRHSGLKNAFPIIAGSLFAEGSLSVVATLSPVSRTSDFVEAVQALETPVETRVLSLGPMSRDEIRVRGIGDDEAASLLRVTGGRPVWVDHLAEGVGRGHDLETSLIDGLTPPYGFLHQECRFDYHLHVERCRGDAVVRTIMALLAGEGQAGLTRIARYIKTSLPTALDYLFWMLEVAMIRRDGRSYSIADPIMAAWVSINGPAGVPIGDAVARLVRPGAAVPPPPDTGEADTEPEPPTPPSPRPLSDTPDSLMEID